MKLVPSSLICAAIALLFLASACTKQVSSQSNIQPTSFVDCEACPEMISISSGTFLLGSGPNEPGSQTDERPQKEIAISEFAISRFEITYGQFRAFVEDVDYKDESICLSMEESGGWAHDPNRNWQNPGFEQDPDHPVVCLSWKAAIDYVAWLNKQSNSDDYRLLTESEWEYAARAGSTSVYWWGNNEDDFCGVTNGVDRSAQTRFPSWVRAGKCDDGFVFTAPVGIYNQPNAFGVEDMVGNVWEWVSDCYVDNYISKPTDGAAQNEEGACERRVMRGGAWGDYGAFYLRSAYRGAWDPAQSFTNLGLRVAKSTEGSSD